MIILEKKLKYEYIEEYTNFEKENFKNGKVRIVNCEDYIVLFIKKSSKINSSNIKLYFGKINNKLSEKIYNDIGVNLCNYNLSLKMDAVKHIFNHHSLNDEMLRGQIPIDINDFKLIFDIIINYDMVKSSGVTKQNKPSITFIKNNKYKYYLVCYISDKRKCLEIQTYYKKKNSATVSNASKSLD